MFKIEKLQMTVKLQKVPLYVVTHHKYCMHLVTLFKYCIFYFVVFCWVSVKYFYANISKIILILFSFPAKNRAQNSRVVHDSCTILSGFGAEKNLSSTKLQTCTQYKGLTLLVTSLIFSTALF